MICGIICQQTDAGAGVGTTWDPDKKHADITLSGGNLIATQTTTGNYRNVKSIAGFDTGKRYFECRLNAATSAADVVVIGLGTVAASLSTFISQTGGSSYSCGLTADGLAYNGPSGGVGVDVGKPIAVAEWAGMAVDFTASKAWVRDASGWSGDPEAGTGNSFTLPGNVLYAMAGGFTTGDEIEANFASGFAYAIPSGFTAWTGSGVGEEDSEGVAAAAGAGAALGISEGTVAAVAAASGTGASSVVGGTASGDPNIADVLLLSGFEGADAATAFVDEGPDARTLTTVGNAQIDTAQFKYGTSSALFDGTGDGITAPDSTDWDFAGEFTVECFARFPSAAGNFVRSLLSKTLNSSAIGWELNAQFLGGGGGTSGSALFGFSTAGTVYNHSISGGTLLANTWYHIAADRDASNKMRLYVDGVMVASKTSATGTSFNTTSTLGIGKRGNIDQPMNGWIDEVRITAGVARYASDGGFTPPAAAFPRS